MPLIAVTAGRQLIALIGLLLLGVPTVLLGMSLVDHVTDLEPVAGGHAICHPPAESVREWPIVGEQVYQLWLAASEP